MKKRDIIFWILSGFCFMFALVNGWHYSTIFLILSAILLAPIPKIKAFLQEKLKLRNAIIYLLAVILFFTAALTSPLESNDDSSINSSTSYSQEISESESKDSSSERESASSSSEKESVSISESSEKESASRPNSTESSSSSVQIKTTYILNTNSKKIHHVGCSAANRISSSNKKTTTKSLSSLLSEGYTKCGLCF